MKKLFICISLSFFLLFSGCSKMPSLDIDINKELSNIEDSIAELLPSSEDASEEYDAAYYKDLVSDTYALLPYRESTDTYAIQDPLFMADPEILSYDQEGNVTARGYLYNDVYITTEPYTVKYSYLMTMDQKLFKDAVIDVEHLIVKPAPILEDNLYGVAKVTCIRGSGKDEYINADNWANIEIYDGTWINDYSWEGTLLFTRHDGTQYLSEMCKITFGYQDWYNAGNKWLHEKAVIFLNPYQ